jgi:uncharacterized protein
MHNIDALEIISFFYPEDDEFRRLLIDHCMKVEKKAFEILSESGVYADKTIVSNGALLHDIGIGKCHAPSIFCKGELPYIRHGIAGAEMLRQYAKQYGIDLELYAAICERHTGSGLSAEDIKTQGLPLPEKDFLPQSTEEKLICLADKFFSKSGSGKEKTISDISRSMQKFGGKSLERFEILCDFFKVKR